MALWGLATLGVTPAEALPSLADRLEGCEMELGPQGLPNVLWALARFEDSASAPASMLEGLQVRSRASLSSLLCSTEMSKTVHLTFVIL
jgi:hypothetical protein